MAVKYSNAEKRAAQAKEFGTNLSNWAGHYVGKHNNITGVLPKLKPKLGGTKTNAQLAKEWDVTPRQASKIRNHKRPLPLSTVEKVAA
jgi:hypothetical protein